MAFVISRPPLSSPNPSLFSRSQPITRHFPKPPTYSGGFNHFGFPKGLSLSVKASAASTIGNSKVVGSDDEAIKKPIIVIDNYDSFTYNLCQYLGEMGCSFEVYRNDELSVDELKSKKPRGVLISPGPGTPQDSGISLQTVLELGPTVPLFGVCMGLQCIGEAFGGKVVRSPYGVMHGKSSPVYYDEKGHDGLFAGLPNPFIVGRYHSLVIEEDSFPSDELEITAWTDDGLIMAARHKRHKHLQGVQFHPESIITTEGKMIVRNFIKMVEEANHNTFLFKNLPRIAYSSITRSGVLLLSNGGKNSQAAVTMTNPTVNDPETARCSRHLLPAAILMSNSTTKHAPCKRKKHVTSHVGDARVKMANTHSCMTPETRKDAKTPTRIDGFLPISGVAMLRIGL
ncbi:hypothetical protein V2J09_011614 [Rumex salicifolius]